MATKRKAKKGAKKKAKRTGKKKTRKTKPRKKAPKPAPKMAPEAMHELEVTPPPMPEAQPTTETPPASEWTQPSESQGGPTPSQ